MHTTSALSIVFINLKEIDKKRDIVGKKRKWNKDTTEMTCRHWNILKKKEREKVNCLPR